MDVLTTLLNEKFGVEETAVADDTVLETLDLDSLALVELFLVIQKRWGVVIEVGDVKADDTVGDLARRLAAGLS
jgi:acyl carrier protein